MGISRSKESDKDVVSITYQLPGSDPTTENFDFLVVACDPRLLPVSDRTDLERKVNDTLTSFTFRTSLFRAKRPAFPQIPIGGGPKGDTPQYAVRFNPSTLAPMKGEPYAVRDEVMARDKNFEPSSTGVTWSVMYQLDREGLIGRDPQQVASEMDQKRDLAIQTSVANRGWIDFLPDPSEKPQPEVAELVDYFPHFDPRELAQNLPWEVRDHQGEKSTVYVSSFTCFESVLSIFLYEAELMRKDGNVVNKYFPTDKNAKIAVVGAGPAGILFASQHLKKQGYNNFKLFEKSDRYGGKTMTHYRTAPDDPTIRVPCELGTCYLSLGYEPMFPLFEEYDAGDVVALDRDSNIFRSVVDAEVADTEEETENGVEYNAWTRRKNGSIMLVENVKILLASVKYIAVHYATMGMTINDSIPDEPPTESGVLENLARLVGLADEQSEEEKMYKDKVLARDLYAVLKNEKRDKDKTVFKPRGLFEIIDDLTPDISDLQDWIDVEDLKKACRTVFNTTYAEFLDENDMSSLKPIFVYGYQVQGYGTLEIIPAYYGYVLRYPN